MTKTGWFNRNKTGYSVKHESRRHSLAAKGIKTALPKGSKCVTLCAGISTPNFDMVAKDMDMRLDYLKILKGLGFHEKDIFIKNNKVHVRLYNKWYRVKKNTLCALHDLKEVLSAFLKKYDINKPYEPPIESPYGKKTILSYGRKKVSYEKLKKLEKLPFIKKGFAEKHKGKSKNIVYRDILDKLPLIGKDFTRKDAIGYFR